MAWLGSWEKRIKLTIDNGDIDANLTDFPILVHLSTSSGIGGVDVSAVFDELTSDANRKKIAITTSDGQTQCHVEIEKWNDASEEAWLWVKVPSVASGSDTILYLYYDVAQADNNTYVGDTNSTPAENVWDANFILVDHMEDGADNAHTRDSTSNDNDGTKTGANEPIESAGQIGKQQTFDGINDTIDIGDVDINHITVEVLAKSADLKDQGLVSKYGLGTARAWLIEPLIGGGVTCIVYLVGNVANSVVIPDIDYEDNVLRYYAITYDGAILRTFIDDVAKGTDNTNSGNIKNIANYIFIGKEERNARFWKGSIDEVRISDTDRTEAWLFATVESLKDGLITFGTEVVLTQAVWDFFTWA